MRENITNGNIEKKKRKMNNRGSMNKKRQMLLIDYNSTIPIRKMIEKGNEQMHTYQ